MKKIALRETFSLCPVCLLRISAQHVQIGSDIFLEKNCPSHGSFSTIIWRGNDEFPMDAWQGHMPELTAENCPNCPEECGLCAAHLRDTCCVVLEVTDRCNLHCPYCLAGDTVAREPTADELRRRIRVLAQKHGGFLQLSGGEPTMRNDLPELVQYAKEVGFRYIQLNSNGLRLARDEGFVRALRQAGLSFVFLQYDGTSDLVYEALRGIPLLKEKQKAIETCGRCGLGVILVPTLTPGINIQEIGPIIRVAASLSPVVRGVHFQPVGYFGRYPYPPRNEMRFTLPELVQEIESQCNGAISREHLIPSRCDHALCGFHGSFVVFPDGLHPTSEKGCCACSDSSSAEQNRNYIGRRWERREYPEKVDAQCSTMDGFLQRVRSHGFTVTAMAFQDAWNVDLERLRQCSLHIYDGKSLMPFCVHYLAGAR